ncbi:Potassium channel subfamily U member 1 [Apodemus speciosus]|uniref:Potassium channel subfamily U member 1 n=1 Tax=Apodemus speciosus TaxID=105296 RepID=A0ABQ0FRJ2_APOSI
MELFSSRRIEANPLRKLYFHGIFRERIEMLLSAQTFVGQVLVILVFVLSIGSLVIYFINSMDPVRRCSSYEDKIVHVDLSFNAFFSFYFGLRGCGVFTYVRRHRCQKRVSDPLELKLQMVVSHHICAGKLNLDPLEEQQTRVASNSQRSTCFCLPSAGIKGFWAAEDKIKFWLEMNSIVDIFTIPPTFISYYLKSNWLGLRFLRALRLLELPKILQILQVIKTRQFSEAFQTAVNSYQYLVHSSRIPSPALNSMPHSGIYQCDRPLLETGEGPRQSVENSGDPWLNGRNSQTMSYFESIYLVTATMSTVGFGDVVAKTSLGRIFIVFFTLGSLILFANYIPEMVELFSTRKKYTKPYEAVKGKKFIVVCGNITIDSVTAFLRNFLHRKAGEINIEIVFLGETPPTVELETVLKCHTSCTTFVCGTALKFEDLKRVARVLSVKNYYPQTRVIIQILQSQNKIFLSKIPNWDWSAGDNIICFAELKLGFIAQGCLVPGLCTFLTTLFIEQNQKVFPKHPWQKHFLNGLKNKILTQRLSNDFVGMTFPQVSRKSRLTHTPPGVVTHRLRTTPVAGSTSHHMLDCFTSVPFGVLAERLCFVKMHLMLIAIQHKPLFHNYRTLILNPSSQVRLNKDTLGFFIAESSKDVKRAFFYCSTCHSDVYTPEMIGKCNCKGKSRQQLIAPTIMVMSSSLNEFPATEYATSSQVHTSMSREIHTSISREQASSVTIATTRYVPTDNGEETDMLDSSRMFHWCRSMPFDQVVLKRTDKTKHEFQNHIVACVFGDANCTLVGLRNFVMPLRASNYTRQELKDIVFIGSLEYFQREWRFLRNFPKIHIMPGSALYTGDLRAVNIEQCSMCVILATPYKALSSQILVDTETIMATLNIQSLRIICPAPVSSKTDIKASTSFSSYEGKKRYRQIPILTELKNPSNIHFIEQMGGLDGALKGTGLHLSTSFSTGAVFSGTFLDSLLATGSEVQSVIIKVGSMAASSMVLERELRVVHLDLKAASSFYNYHVLELLQMLVTGGISSQMEHDFIKEKQRETADGSGTSGRMRCKLGLLSLDETILSDINNSRFVITRPSNECHLLPSDLVFCAIPFSTTCNKSESNSSTQIQDNTTNVTPLAQGLSFYDAFNIHDP